LDKLIAIWVEENHHTINRETPLNENSEIALEKYISDLMIVSIDVMFHDYTFFDSYFFQDEKYNFIRRSRYGLISRGLPRL